MEKKTYVCMYEIMQQQISLLLKYIKLFCRAAFNRIHICKHRSFKGYISSRSDC